jgi:predicted Rossmann fold nucleotide-binding protein DprA/Smf involved in DNA uptake
MSKTFGALQNWFDRAKAFEKEAQDICQNRHKGNEESREAFETVKDRLTKSREEVFSFIKSCGDRGATTDEIAVHFGKTPNAVSGRVSELKERGRIKVDGRRKTRSGCPAGVVKAV